ncbi:MAG: DUF6188 family protein [Gemmatimonadales bacterium]
MAVDLTLLLGLRCTAVVREPHSWHFAFNGGTALVAECPWRVLVEGRIALGSTDDRQRFGLPQPVDAQLRAQNLLGDRAVLTAAVTADAGDLALSFDGAVRLDLFNGSSGYEGWSLSAPTGGRIIALGGGELAILPR